MDKQTELTLKILNIRLEILEQYIINNVPDAKEWFSKEFTYRNKQMLEEIKESENV